MGGELVNAWWALMVLGICAGILSGTLGLGSGTLIIPALVLLFNFPQKSAQGTCLAVIVPMALVGAIRYGMNPEIEVDIAKVGLLAAGAVAGAFLGTELARRLSSEVLRKSFAVFMVIVAAKMLLTTARPKTAVPSQMHTNRVKPVEIDRGGMNTDSERH